jgi:hypothetical protein
MANKSIIPEGNIFIALLCSKNIMINITRLPIAQYDDVKIDENIFKKLLDKIIVIKRENPLYKSMMKEFDEAKKQLEIIENYFYSNEFLKAYFNYV